MTLTFFHIDIAEIIKSVGYVGLFLTIFAESGLFFGFFLPGASLLFTAGLLASQNFFNIYILTATLVTAAILGDTTGYWFGAKVGTKLFTREDSRFFKKKYLEQTRIFYEKYGPQAVMLGRFVPVVRTFVPILAGIVKMKYLKFLRYNVIGGTVWGLGVTLFGYFLGSSIPNAERYFLPVVLLIILVTTLPLFYEIWKHRKEVQESI
jgi:membrane-associated protein